MEGMTFMDSNLQDILGSIGGGRVSYDNTPGLGDYHLRSAVKKVSERVINEQVGRFREVENIKAFKEMFKGEVISSGDPTSLLMEFLSVKDHLLLEDAALLTARRQKILSWSKEMIFRRIAMEIDDDKVRFNQDRANSDGIFSSNEPKSLREKLMKQSLLFNTDTGYSNIRVITESIVSGMNAVSSKRDLSSTILREPFRYVKKENTYMSYFAIRLNSMFIIAFSDLIFVKNIAPLRLGPFVEELHKMRSISGEVKNVLLEMSKLRRFYAGWKVYSSDSMRMINDKLTERDIIIRTCNWMNPIMPTIYPTSQKISEMFSIIDVCLLKLGSQGYKMVKCFESLCIGVLLSRANNIIVDGDEFLDSTEKDLVEEFPESKIYVRDLLIFLKSPDNSDHHLSQFYGLYRLWGHPVVNSIEGLKKVKRIGTQKKDILDTYAKKGSYVFLEIIFLEYYNKVGSYPQFELNEEAVLSDNVFVEQDIVEGTVKVKSSDFLISCLGSGKKMNKKSSLYSLESWKYIVPMKTFSVPKTFNLAMVVDDKAISPPKSYLVKVAKKEASLMNPKERRGVLKWLDSSFLRCDEFLNRIDQNGLDDDDCVIGLYPKERELNMVPRMFSLMSAEMRNYVVVTEHMIAHDILRYFPQITMTNNLLDLTKKIYGATRAQERSRKVGDSGNTAGKFSVTVCVNMDFEKWNLNMRYESTKHVFEMIGRLYGMPNLYNRTYEIFENSYIYVSDESYSITLDQETHTKLETDGKYSYSGHIGGFEGLRQKGWTVFTVAIIMMICKEYPVLFKLMGQGDNQVLMLTMTTCDLDEFGRPSPEGVLELRSLLDKIMTEMSEVFLCLGLPLKSLESWKSEEFFLYGKFPVKNGVPLSMSLKKICRAFPFSNDDSMTIDNVLGSIFTNAQSAAMSDISHLPSYYASLIEAYIGVAGLLQYHPMTGAGLINNISNEPFWTGIVQNHAGIKHRKSFDIELEKMPNLSVLLESLIILPKSLGGTNGITEYEFVMRGFPDNQTRDMSYLTRIVNNIKRIEEEIVGLSSLRDIIERFMRFNFSTTSNFEFLVEDPCSINLVAPGTPLTILRHEIKRVLSSHQGRFQNREFMSLFQMTNDENRKLLMTALVEEDRLFPRILHDCYASTLYGYVDGIVSKVDKTVTIQRICLEESEEDIMKKIMKGESNYMRFLIWRMMEDREEYNGEPDPLICPTNYIRWARYFGWGKQVLGVTVPFPAHLLCVEPQSKSINSDCPDDNFMSCFISDETPSNLEKLVSSIGRSLPYLGSYTKEKVKNYDKVALYGSEPLLSRSMHLMSTIGWTFGKESNIYAFLKDVMSKCSDIDPDIFAVNPDHVSGSIEHRYRDMALKHGALVTCLYTLGTYMHISTDTLSHYAKGGKNVTLHFQSLLCWVQSLVSEILLDSRMSEGSLQKEIHLHMVCESCIVPVDDDIPDIPKIPATIIPEMKDNPYCYTTGVELQVRDKSIRSFKDGVIINREIGLEELDNRERIILAHEHWAFETVTWMINESDSKYEESMGSGSMEIGKFLRISYLTMNPLLMVRIVISQVIFCSIDEMRNNDTHSESVITLESVKAHAFKKISSWSRDGFLGLAMFFSWPGKAIQIASSYNIILPGEFPLSVEACCSTAKSWALSDLDKVASWSDIKVHSKYVNATSGGASSMAMLARHFNLYVDYSEGNICPNCVESLVKDHKTFEIYNHTERFCKKGHSYFFISWFKRWVTFVLISDELLSKTLISDSGVIKPHSMAKSFDFDVNLIGRARKFAGVVMSNKDEIYLSSSAETRLELTLYRDKFIRSRLFRLIPYDTSSSYRLLELLLQLRVRIKNHDEILILGDGVGNSGSLVSSFSRRRVHTMTMSDCTKAFPQTYPHAIPPRHFDSDAFELLDASLSRKLRGDALDENFSMNLNKFIIKNRHIAMMISEIEIEHSPNVSLDEYPKLVKSLALIQVDMSIIKIRWESSRSLYDCIRILKSVYRDVQVFAGSFCNYHLGEVYLISRHRNLDILKIGEKRNLSAASTRHIANVMTPYLTGHLSEHADVNYYNALNDILLGEKVIEKSKRMISMFFSRVDGNDSIWGENFTKILLGIKKMGFLRTAGHGALEKKKYIYDNDLSYIAEVILTIGLSLVMKDGVVLYVLDNISSYWIVCYADRQELVRGGIRKFSYMVIHGSEKDKLEEEHPYYMYHSLQISPDMRSNLMRYVPFIREHKKKNCFMWDGTFLNRIIFKYDRNMIGDDNTLYLSISKIVGRSLPNLSY